MAGLADALRDPIALTPNRIPRFYRGGRLLEDFRGHAGAVDDDRPEDWVGSATRTWTPAGAPSSTLGPSVVRVGDEMATMEDVLAREPEALIGRALLERSGPTLGLLVKLLDAGERLPVHCHPSREAASRLLASPFGKTEAWIILGTRSDDARIWAGFRDAVDRDTLRRWTDRQETDRLLAALVEHRVQPGDAFLIPAGTPHAIGAGVFLLELQEPTDFSVVAEMRGFPIAPDDASLGLGWDTAIDFFDTDPTRDLRQRPSDDASLVRLLGADADPYFRAVRLEVDGEAAVNVEPTFAIGVVMAGSGEISGATRSLPLSRGTTFALAARGVPRARLAGDRLELVLCLPPEPAFAPAR